MEQFKAYVHQACHSEHAQSVQRYANDLSHSARTNPRAFLYGSILVLASIWVFVTAVARLRRRSLPSQSRPRTPDPEKKANYSVPGGFKFAMQKPGVWVPSDFKRPDPVPYPDWSFENTKPLPYRPFRPKYFVTLGLRNMDWNEWIEIDNHWPKFHEAKMRRIRERGKKCCHTDPQAFDAAIELLEEMCDYLPKRYPSMWEKTDVGMNNLKTGESYNIVERPLKEDPMQIAAQFVQDDLAIMIEKEDGQYYLLAGAILLAGFWRLEDKLGMPLSEIHTSGDVPQFKEKLEKGMMNFFRRLKPEAPMLRNNYFIQVDDDLAWSYSIGEEDCEEVSWNTAEKNKAVEHHHFRSERQSLRRLPRSGGVVFTIRTYFHPVTEICEEPYVPGRLASAVRSWADDVSRYRGRERYQDVLLEYLDKKHEEQLANGLQPDKEDEHHHYPY